MKHLTKKVNRYYLHWNVPKDLRHLFNGRAALTRTLQTSDLGVALLRRDQAVAELDKLVRKTRDAHENQQFLSFVEDLRKLSGLQEGSTSNTSGSAPLAMGCRLELMNSSTMPAPTTHEVPITQAIKSDSSWVDTTASTLESIGPKQGALLKEAVRLYLKDANGSLSAGAVSRLKMAPSLFLQHLDRNDIHLTDIDRRDVIAWVKACSIKKAAATIKAYLIGMSNVWEWAYLNRKVEGDNPFRALNIRLPPSPNKRGSFTVEQVSTLLDGAVPGLHVLIEFALVTGCRLGELTTLTGFDPIDPDTFSRLGL